MQLRTLWHVGLRRHRKTSLEWFYLRPSSSSTRSGSFDCDLYGIPVQPTWSVHKLLSSYPRPSVPPSTLRRLHELSALIPPSEGTAEYESLIHEMEGLVKLVEAVKLVDTSGLQSASDTRIPDGRIWAEGQGIELEQIVVEPGAAEVSGRRLLPHSTRVRDGMYIVDAEKRK